LSTPLWIEDAKILRSQLPEEVQLALTEHEAAGTTDSAEYIAASEVFYERHMYAGEKTARPAECDGAPWSQSVYEYMWGPSEFYADGTLVDFDLTDRLHEIDVPVMFVTGEFDEARPETVAEFHKLVPGSQLMVTPGVGHASMSKKPQEYRDLLEKFLDSVEDKKKHQ
jgi:proline iminopeptidase